MNLSNNYFLVDLEGPEGAFKILGKFENKKDRISASPIFGTIPGESAWMKSENAKDKDFEYNEEFLNFEGVKLLRKKEI